MFSSLFLNLKITVAMYNYSETIKTFVSVGMPMT